MATIGYKGALGGMAKDAISGAGNALVGGLKGAVLREMPAVSAGMAFGKELSKRANAPKMKPGDTPPPVNEQTSTSPAMGGFGASVSLVAGQNKSNVINLEQVRQLKQLNDSVITQSKLIAFQIADQKRKDQFAEESANEQAVRDDALLNAIKNIGGGGGKGKGKGEGNEKGGGLGILGDAAASAAGGAAGSWLKSIGLAIISGVTTAAVAAFAFFRNAIFSLARTLVLSAALRFGGGAALGSAATAVAGGAVTLSAASIAALAALIAGLLYSKDAGAAKGKHADTINGRDAAIDPVGAARRRAAENATQKRVPTRKMAGDSAKWYESRESREKQWDEQYAKTHDPETGLLKDPKATTIFTPPAAGKVTSNFGEKRKDATGKETIHQGVDIAMASGTPVRPIASGKVTKVQTSGDAGTYVQVTHPDGKISEYMHLSKALAKVNEEVTLASVIGESGGAKGDLGAGKSTGPHLHLQLKDASGAFINPSTLPGLAGLTQGQKVSPADNTPKISARDAVDDTGKQKHTGPNISNKEAENYLKGLGVGAGGSTSNVGIVDKNLIANKIADRMDAEASANTIGTGGVKSRGVADKISISDALRGLSAEEIAAMIPDFSRRYPGIQLAAGPGFKLGGGGGDWDGEDRIVAQGADRSMGGGTGLKFKKEKTEVIDKDNLEVNKKQLAQAKLQAKGGTALSTKEANDGIERQTKALKPLFRNNSDIIAETNKTFLNQFRSTATGIFTQAITKGLFPKGFGVSAAEAGRDDNYRGQQLQKIFGTNDKINEATTKLLGKQYGPMFAPLFNNLAQGYLEVGSRIAGRTVFQDLSKFGIGGLGAKETQELTGQIFGNFAAGNKKLALEQLLYGASGGKESGIALGPETLFAKYGFKNPAEGIQYFSSVLGEKVTQPFSKLMGADDRSKSVVWNPRAGKDGTGAYVYVDSGREASKEDIDKMGNYGAPVNSTSVSNALGDYNNFRDPYGPGGPRNIVNGTYTGAGSASAYRQVVDPDTGKMVAPSKRQILNLSNEEYMRDKVGNDQKADIQIELMKQDADKKAKFHAETIKAAAEREAKQLEANKQDEEAAKVRSQAEVKANEYVTKNGADSIVVAVEKAGGGGGSGSTPTGLEPPKAGDIVRKSGQLFGGTADGKGGVSPLSGMQEIGNFAFDMAKNALGSKMTENIKNPYMQMVANFAIQKGMNMGIDYLMKTGGIGDTLMKGAGDFLGNAASSAGNWIMDTALPGITSWFSGLFADGGPVVGPGTGRSDSIPAMLSNGEFVVNAAASKKYRPLLDALNYTKYADGTNSAPGSVNALSKALGTDKTLSSLGDQTDLLKSIDTSLLYLSGGGSGSGTSFSSYGGTAFDVGLGSPSGGSVSSGGRNTVSGVSRSRPTQQKPSTMDYVSAIGGSMLKSFAMNQVIGAASTALFGATPGVLAGNALISAGFPTLGGMLGGTLMTGTGLTAGAGGIGLTAGSGAASLASMGGGTGLVAGSNVIGGSLGTSTVASGTGSLLAVEGGVGATTAAGAGTLGSIGSSLVAAAPYLLAAVAVFMIIDSYGGGGGGGPPPKEPKFHAAIYVAGNNNISAIATILETTDYHAVPDVYKTVAYGLLKVAFNATKTSEAVSKTAPPYDWVYVKVQFDRVSLLWGKGAPNASSIIDDSATEVKRWPALEESTNLNAYASDILALVRDEFKKTAKADQLDRLDKTASALGDYSLHTLSSGLVQDLKSGNYALDTSVEKGVFADNVAESARISELIRVSNANAAYITQDTEAEYGNDPNDTEYRNGVNQIKIKDAVKGGVNMVYSMKQKKFVVNPYGLDVILLDDQDRPVYNIEGTSAGLSVEDFVSASIAGTTRSANILQPPPATTGAGGAGGTNNTVVKGPTIDNSQVTTFVNSLTTVTDVVRSSTTQVGLIG
jgi:murein DD-endopeptidase MepM/ murein hydrolase activator NlpD